MEPTALEPMSLLGWIVIGAFAGWLAGRIVTGYGFGLIGNVVVGIVGASIAGLILPGLGTGTDSTLGNLVAATLGAVVLLVVIGLLKRG